MKKFIFTATVALGLMCSMNISAQEAPANDKYKTELSAYLKVSGALASFDGMIEQVFAMLAGNLTDEEKTGLKEKALEKLIFFYTPVYKESISLEDLKAMNEFYSTPAGKRIAAAQPAISAKAATIGQNWAMWLQGEVQSAAK